MSRTLFHHHRMLEECLCHYKVWTRKSTTTAPEHPEMFFFARRRRVKMFHPTKGLFDWRFSASRALEKRYRSQSSVHSTLHIHRYPQMAIKQIGNGLLKSPTVIFDFHWFPYFQTNPQKKGTRHHSISFPSSMSGIVWDIRPLEQKENQHTQS